MEIILNQDVVKLGYKGDVLTVRPGYARNFLIPNGLATVATVSSKKVNEENMRQASHKFAKIKSDAEELAAKLDGMKLQFTAKTASTGRIFGSVTTLQISQMLKDNGIEIDRRKLAIAGDIKELGNYEVTADLHREVKAKFNIEVIAEA